MQSRRRRLEGSRLYLVIDKDTLKQPLQNISAKMSKAGVGLIQLRDKKSSRAEILKEALIIAKALKRSRALFIVNDYLDIAKLSGADGVHLGQFDLPVKEARRSLGKNKLIGVSCSNLKQAEKAQREGADYIGIGPVFKTKTKPGCQALGINCLRVLKGKIKIPVFAIGNIHQGNLSEIISSGINRVALCRAVLDARDPFKAARYFSAKLNELK